MNLSSVDYLFIAKRENNQDSEMFSKNIMITYFKLSQEESKVKRSIYGKPYISHKGFYYNIAHNSEWIVMAVSNNTIGVDIERKQRIDNNIKDQILRDIRKWTIYESYIKAIGKGLSIETNEMEITETDNNKGSVKAYKYPIFYYNIYDEMTKNNIVTISRIDNKKDIKIYKL